MVVSNLSPSDIHWASITAKDHYERYVAKHPEVSPEDRAVFMQMCVIAAANSLTQRRRLPGVAELV